MIMGSIVKVGPGRMMPTCGDAVRTSPTTPKRTPKRQKPVGLWAPSNRKQRPHDAHLRHERDGGGEGGGERRGGGGRQREREGEREGEGEGEGEGGRERKSTTSSGGREAGTEGGRREGGRVCLSHPLPHSHSPSLPLSLFSPLNLPPSLFLSLSISISLPSPPPSPPPPPSSPLPLPHTHRLVLLVVGHVWAGVE